MITAVITVVLGWLTPVGPWLSGAADAVRDFGREVIDFDAGIADRVKETEQSRPLWARKPDMLDKSFEFLASYGDASLVTVDGGVKPVVIEPEEAVNNGLRYNGKPIILIGKVINSVGRGC